MAAPKKVVVIIGCGGMGVVIARRLGSGCSILLADASPGQLENATSTLRQEGYTVDGTETDVSSLNAVKELAKRASHIGPIKTIVHTAGLSPIQALPERIYQVDLLGTANVIDAFLEVATAGTSLVVIASMAGHTIQEALATDFEQHLATSPAETLLSHPELDTNVYEANTPEARKASPRAYGISKRANILRVQASAAAFGAKGARINSVSPGVISTVMGQRELDGPYGQHIRKIIDDSPAGRIGTAGDVVNAVAFLASDEASFITGTDLLVDGGSTSSQRWSKGPGLFSR
jgi:NAD(P)-dependent dehydrogenase (short-subunit alcohol dehydrogenase family)